MGFVEWSDSGAEQSTQSHRSWLRRVVSGCGRSFLPSRGHCLLRSRCGWFCLEGVAGGLVEAGGEGVGEGVAFGLEGCEDLVGEVAGVGVFEEDAV